jgi:hypothetical protein
MKKAADKHPIDFDALAVGSVVPAPVLEKAFGVTREMAEYQFHLLKLRQEARKRRPDIEPHIRIRGGALVVLQDSEAETQTRRSFHGLIGRAQAEVSSRQRINYGKLEHSQLVEASHFDGVAGRALAAARREMKTCKQLLGGTSGTDQGETRGALPAHNAQREAERPAGPDLAATTGSGDEAQQDGG